MRDRSISGVKRFAPVVPVKLARALRERGLLGHYHLLLAHDVVAHAKEYQQVYNDGSADCRNNFIIMDNSVIELGQAVSPQMLKEACDIVNARVLALPDVLLNNRETFKSSISCYDAWWNEIDWDSIHPMVIPQGENFLDWCACVKSFARSGIASRCWVGIPRNVKEKLGVSRLIALQFVERFFMSQPPIHMLGFSDDLIDDLFSTRFGKGVMGIDSAVPIRQKHKLEMTQPDPGPRGDWWEKCNPKRLTNDQWDVIQHNMSVIRGYIEI